MFVEAPTGLRTLTRALRLVVDLEHVDAQRLLGRRVDPPQQLQSRLQGLHLGDDLLPRLGTEHVGEVAIHANRLDAHHTRSLTGLELQELSGLHPLDAVVSDTDLEGLLAGHDCVVIRTLDANLSHG